MPDDTPVIWMDRKAVARHLQVTVRTLETWAQRGGGPPYYILRPRLVRYKRHEVDLWASAQPRLHTTDIDGQAADILRQAEVIRSARNLVGRRRR